MVEIKSCILSALSLLVHSIMYVHIYTEYMELFHITIVGKLLNYNFQILVA